MPPEAKMPPLCRQAVPPEAALPPHFAARGIFAAGGKEAASLPPEAKMPPALPPEPLEAKPALPATGAADGENEAIVRVFMKSYDFCEICVFLRNPDNCPPKVGFWMIIRTAAATAKCE